MTPEEQILMERAHELRRSNQEYVDICEQWQECKDSMGEMTALAKLEFMVEVGIGELSMVAQTSIARVIPYIKFRRQWNFTHNFMRVTNLTQASEFATMYAIGEDANAPAT
jgi:hypothetical protein